MSGGHASGPVPLAADLRCLLVVCPSWVGDTIMATPLLRALRGRRPAARIVAAVRPGLDALLAGAPWIDQTITGTMKGVAGPFLFGRRLGRTGAEAALLLPNSFRSALAVRLAGIPVRAGYERDGRGPLLTHRLPVRGAAAPVPAVEYYARLGCFALGAAALERRVELFVTAEEEASADRLLEGVERPFVLLAPGANRAAKRWPAERFAAVADALREGHGLHAAVTGAPGERALTAQVAAAARVPVTDLAARGVSLGPLKAVTRRAALVISNDSGPRHIAAALGTPVITLFGPTDHRWTTLEDLRERRLLAEPFLPGELIADRAPRRCAIGRIPVDDVRSAARCLLSEPQPVPGPPR